MAVNVNALRQSDAPLQADAPTVIPSPAKVQAKAAEIRNAWSPRQRRRRAKVARYMLLQQLLTGFDPVAAVADQQPLRLTPRRSPSRSR